VSAVTCSGTVDYPGLGEVDVVATADVTPAEPQYWDPVRGEGHPGCDAEVELLTLRLDARDGQTLDLDALTRDDRERLEESALESLDCGGDDEPCWSEDR
jgi:hypothetical protein